MLNYNEKEIIDYIHQLDPKIKKALHQTKTEEREDLEQSIKLKILENEEKIVNIQAMGFFEFKEQFSH
ncbi:hypothetical protein AAV35_004450 [Salimicrobium jeotgali]|uniref:Uncharacterized protein n=1 Tax=Salimicrobium jeotgali TaxID=1230341 RepID=K2H629_9BACI|nr:hypothetical protein [Salimicrobium jeotgali]AKG04107.1 hypothetical protein AAV35_004450 [Salimicrobium jeotgali]EKE31235.1 hypothetical protein MJ3_09703 [Salimicrobium jeotgali]MBM7697202.1 hypothetical protein [Salimicrobium jeotgali]